MCLVVKHIVEAHEIHRELIRIEEAKVDKSVKEAKQEVQIAEVKEFWDGAVLNATMYKTTDVPLIKMGDEDFEVLEGHLLLLQSMVASRYVLLPLLLPLLLLVLLS